MVNELNTVEPTASKVHPRGFKFKTIIDFLAWDLFLVLTQLLKNDSLDSDYLKLHFLMTLSDVRPTKKTTAEGGESSAPVYWSNSYVKKLLFRDYSAHKESIWHSFYLPKTEFDSARTVKIHDEAINYLSYVLERRLTLAQNLKDKPTNLHLLLDIFSHFSTLGPSWKLTTCTRHLNYNPANEDKPCFRHVAKVLAKQRHTLGSNYSEISQRRREQYGPIWLEAGECIAEVPEELSLFDVFDALPLSLDANFLDDADLQKRFNRVIDSLNERYKLLRSCGLKPDIWLDRKGPSIAVLRELKQLRTEAEQRLRAGEATVSHLAYRQAFDSIKQQKQSKKLANAHSFDELVETEYGMELLNYSALSLDQSAVEDSMDGNVSLYEAIPATDLEDDLTQSIFAQFDDDSEWIHYLIKTRQELFNDVMIAFFEAVIGASRPLNGEVSEKPLLADEKFRSLILADNRYRNMTDDELMDQLINQAEKIISQGMIATTEGESPSSLYLV